MLTSVATRRAAVVAALYVGLAALWILLSDVALTALDLPTADHARLSILKGWGFVLITGAGLFLGIQWMLRHGWSEGNQARRLLACAGEGLYSIDLNGLCTFANPALAGMLGHAGPEALEGANIHALIHHHHADGAPYPREACPIHGHMAEGTRFRHMRETLFRKDGTPLLVDVAGEPLTDDRGQLIGAIIAVRDITEQERARMALLDSEQRLRVLYENLPVGYQSLDPDGTILEVNRAWLDQMGYRKEEVIGRSIMEFLTDDSRALLPERFAGFKAQRVVHGVEFDMVTGSGRVRRMSVEGRVSLDEAGAVTQTHCVLTDLTERRAFQAALDLTLSDVARADAELLRFSHVVAHDLQEPVREVVSFLDLVRLRLGDNVPSDVAEFMTYACNAGLRMKKRLVALRGFVDVMGQRQHFQPTPLAVVWRDARDALEARIHDSGAHVKADPLPTVVGDPGLLGVLFRVLIDNALRYARPECPPVVHLRVEHEAGAVVLGFLDNGRGIDPTLRARVFEAFARDPHPGDTAASGMGLTVARKICDLHAGTIWIETRPDGGPGILVCVRLPLSPDPEPEAVERAPTSA